MQNGCTSQHVDRQSVMHNLTCNRDYNQSLITSLLFRNQHLTYVVSLKGHDGSTLSITNRITILVQCRGVVYDWDTTRYTEVMNSECCSRSTHKLCSVFSPSFRISFSLILLIRSITRLTVTYVVKFRSGHCLEHHLVQINLCSHLIHRITSLICKE